jgi:hypothetical protein
MWHSELMSDLEQSKYQVGLSPLLLTYLLIYLCAER